MPKEQKKRSIDYFIRADKQDYSVVFYLMDSFGDKVG
jgi:hypothetical protein